MSGGKRSSYPSKQRRAGPAPLASFEDLSDAVESPESPKEADNDDFPLCIMDNQVGQDEEDSGGVSHEDATPSTPRVLVETPSTPLSVGGSLCGSLATTPTPERIDSDKSWSWARRSPLSPLTSPLFGQKKNRKNDANGEGPDRKTKGEEDDPGKGSRTGAGTPSPRSVRKLFTMTLFKPREHQDVRSPTSPIPSPKSPRKSTAATLSGLFKFSSGPNKEEAQNPVLSPSRKKGSHNIVTFFKGAKDNVSTTKEVGEHRSNVPALNQHAKVATSSGGSVLSTFFHRKSEQKGEEVVAVPKGFVEEEDDGAKPTEGLESLEGDIDEAESPTEPVPLDDVDETTLSPVLEERVVIDEAAVPSEDKGSPESESDLEVQTVPGKGDEAEAETLLAEDSPDNEDVGMDVSGEVPPRFDPSPPLLQSARLQRIEDAKTIPIERPRCTAPLSVASLEAYINTVVPLTFMHSESDSFESHSSSTTSTIPQEGAVVAPATKLKVVLPAEEFGTKFGKPRTPKKAAFRSWYEFCEVGLQSPRSRRKESQRSTSGEEVTSFDSTAWSFSEDTPPVSKAWIAFEAVDKSSSGDGIDWGASGSSWSANDPPTPDEAFESPTECECPKAFNM